MTAATARTRPTEVSSGRTTSGSMPTRWRNHSAWASASRSQRVVPPETSTPSTSTAKGSWSATSRTCSSVVSGVHQERVAARGCRRISVPGVSSASSASVTRTVPSARPTQRIVGAPGTRAERVRSSTTSATWKLASRATS
ncbi:hypothetical protein G7075_16655 [Phycicoccus sp. HDW14]|uniref:hypothetical protein n=1 Tax=Phycicoccus sp. HDW14 TaxID=2714941 RepID=UPI00140B529C|nr:hypothetical protein [Phycicoccus sp. HDW14]QIM19876.1 hypothetical protein G7075_16655 [Phycicoccus sp. HDW14]